MRRIVLSFVSLCAALMPHVGSASAADFHNQKLAQWGDPFTLPQTRLRCVNEAKGDWPWGGGWKTCVGWATDVKTMQCEVFLRVPDAGTIPAAARSAAENVAKTCAGVALATGAGVFTGTPSPELGARIAAALAVMKPAFITCVQSEGGAALAALSLTLEQSCGWSSWSNE